MHVFDGVADAKDLSVSVACVIMRSGEKYNQHEGIRNIKVNYRMPNVYAVLLFKSQFAGSLLRMRESDDFFQFQITSE